MSKKAAERRLRKTRRNHVISRRKWIGRETDGEPVWRLMRETGGMGDDARSPAMTPQSSEKSPPGLN